MDANSISENGFIAGWEKALLGNSLSCLANMFLLSQRTGLPAVFTYPTAYSDLFLRSDISIIDPYQRFKSDGLHAFLEKNSPLFSKEPILCADHYTGVSYEEIDNLKERGKVLFTQYQVGLSDWRDNNAERAIRRYCHQGNGVIISGCYWKQYLDMRQVCRDGDALKNHLGPLRQDSRRGRRSRLSMEGVVSCLRIGVHFRLAKDYSVWHGGVYHFKVEETLSVMRSISRELGSRPHTFHLYSDVQLDTELFEGLSIHYERGSFHDDFLSISSCDYIVGPPSTFASWASFLGNAKRVVLTRERINRENTKYLLESVPVPFPTGHYLPGDETCTII